MQNTANYGFLKPEDNEAFDQQAHANANMDAIDVEIKARSDGLAAHLADNVPHIPYVAAAGVANTYTATLNPAPTAYAEGMAMAVKINVDNTGASTINVNGLGAKSIKKPNGNDVSAGNLKAGSIYTTRYSGTNFILQGSDAAGDATPANVLTGKAFTNDTGEQTGTMTNHGIVTITPSTVDQAISEYYAPTSKVLGDADLISANIKAGANIFGVVGTAKYQFGIKGSALESFGFDLEIGTTSSKFVDLNCATDGTLVAVATYSLRNTSTSDANKISIELYIDGVLVYNTTGLVVGHNYLEYVHDTLIYTKDVASGTRRIELRIIRDATSTGNDPAIFMNGVAGQLVSM